jgi:hypothetical protein
MTGISGAGTRILGAERRISDAGAEAVLLGAECRHLAGEVLDLLQKCGVVGGWTNASKRRMGFDLRVAVLTACFGFQAALILTVESGQYVEG